MQYGMAVCLHCSVGTIQTICYMSLGSLYNTKPDTQFKLYCWVNAMCPSLYYTTFTVGTKEWDVYWCGLPRGPVSPKLQVPYPKGGRHTIPKLDLEEATQQLCHYTAQVTVSLFVRGH